MTNSSDTCPNCATEVRVVSERRSVPVGRRTVEIDDEFLRCPACGEEFYSTDLARRSHRKAIAAARSADSLLAPERIKAIRESLGLTQREFESLLGVGEKTCVRWESGRVCQNAATDRLIRLIAANRDNARVLAGINGVALPDSCYVPAEPAEVLNRLGAPWDRPGPAATSIVIGGTAEVRGETAGEQTALREAATHEIHLLRVTGSDWPTEFLRTSTPGSRGGQAQ